MPISPSGGVNERERTLIPEDALSDVDGAEYRVGQRGLFVTRGRALYGTLSGVTGRGLYEAGFDAGDRVILHSGNSYHAAIVGSTLTFALVDGFGTGTSHMVGAHSAGRHYTANGVGNRRLEYTATGVTSHPIGMSRSTLGIGTSVTQGVGSMSATTGLAYWVTEYDSARGIESMTGSSANSGPISAKDSVIVTATGVSANRLADQLRWYRSTDGGGFPDGGLIATTPIGTTQIADTNTGTGSLTVPLYGIVSVGGLDTERDEPPPVLSSIFGPFQHSLCGVGVDEPRVLRVTPAGFPDSWPAQYAVPIETSRNDVIVGGAVLPGRIGVFCRDSVHVVYRYPRDSDSVFAAAEAQDEVTLAHGLASARGVAAFSPMNSPALIAWVCRCGIFTTNLTTAISPVTDGIRWRERVSIAHLGESRLQDDSTNRRLIFTYRRVTDTTHNTGVWYLDYQEYETRGLRVTFADHGPLADVVTIAATDGERRAISVDSRSGVGKVYLESTQDVDDSQLVDSSGSVRFRMRLKEFLPAGAKGTQAMGDATWMHDAGPSKIEHRFYFDRRDSNPEVKQFEHPTERNADKVGLNRDINSVSLEIASVGTRSYGVHWVDIEGLDRGRLGGRKGA